MRKIKTNKDVEIAMFIIRIKGNPNAYWTDEITKTKGKVKFERTTKNGKKIKHEISEDEIAEIEELEGNLEDFRDENE